MSIRTLGYYNKNFEIFSKDTFDVSMKKIQDRFSSYIREGGYILDFGCGSGRDTKYFLNKGFRVDAVDGSEKMCEIACKNTGIEVKTQLFSELDDINTYDGIWACSSILHLARVLFTIVGHCETHPFLNKILICRTFCVH